MALSEEEFLKLYGDMGAEQLLDQSNLSISELLHLGMYILESVQNRYDELRGCFEHDDIQAACADLFSYFREPTEATRLRLADFSHFAQPIVPTNSLQEAAWILFDLAKLFRSTDDLQNPQKVLDIVYQNISSYINSIRLGGSTVPELEQRIIQAERAELQIKRQILVILSERGEIHEF